MVPPVRAQLEEFTTKMAPFAEEGCKLFVYGVATQTPKEDLQTEFERFGNVTDAYNSGKGFVEQIFFACLMLIMLLGMHSLLTNQRRRQTRPRKC